MFLIAQLIISMIAIATYDNCNHNATQTIFVLAGFWFLFNLFVKINIKGDIVIEKGNEDVK